MQGFRSTSAPAAALLFVGVGAQEGPAVFSRGGEIVLKVQDYARARSEAIEIVKAAGGTVEEDQADSHSTGRRFGSLAFDCPSGAVSQAAEKLRGLGIIASQKESTTDYGQQVRELEGRLQRLAVHRDRLKAMLNGARNLRASDRLYLLERIFRSELDEESMQQQVSRIKAQAGASRLSLVMFEPATEVRLHSDSFRGHLAASLDQAWMDAGKGIGNLVGGLIGLLIILPVWLPVLAALWFGGRWLGRRIGLLPPKTGKPKAA